MSRARLLIVTCVFFVLTIASFGVFGIVVMTGHFELSDLYSMDSEYRQLKYQGFSFTEYKGTVLALQVAPSDGEPLPKLFLKLSSKPNMTFVLTSIQKGDAAGLAISQETIEGVDNTIIYEYGFGGRSCIRFKNDTAIALRVSGGEVTVSPSQSGTFLALPAKLEEVIRVFGQPAEFQTQRQRFM